MNKKHNFRKSYPGISLKIHPDVKKRNFDFKVNTNSGRKNEKIIKKMLSEFSSELEKANSGTGEWEWLQQNKQKNFIKALANKEIKKTATLLSNMFKNECTYGYLSPSFYDAKRNKERVSSNILCNVDSCSEFSDLKSESQLTTICGNPFGLKKNKKVILPDTPRHFYYSFIFSKLLKKESPFIFEIGGGYGGVCLQTWKRFKKKCTIVNVDLMPALILTYFYLKKNKVPVQFVKDQKEIKKKFVNLVSSQNLKFLNSFNMKIDLIFNSRSLCEMSKKSIQSYFKFINSSKTSFFYHENSNFLLFPKSKRHIEILADHFPVNENKYFLISKCLTPFTGGSGRWREYVYKRIK